MTEKRTDAVRDLRLALQVPPQSLFRMEVAAASLSTVVYAEDGTATVQALNDTHHVNRTAREAPGARADIGVNRG